MKRIFVLLLIIVLLLAYHLYILKNNEPKINIMHNFLSESECTNIINSCKTFEKSSTTDGRTKQKSLGRTSETVAIKNGENIWIDNIKEKVSSMFGIDKSCMETAQVTRYTHGQEYKYHYDYFKSKVENQRKSTILIYLNSLNELDGGQTKFFYGKSIQPTMGTMVKWENIDDNGKKILNTLHSSTPILTDATKYILTIWIRCKPIFKD